MKCNQLCPYNTLQGCKVNEMKGVCPLVNIAEPFGKTEQLPPLADKDKKRKILKKVFRHTGYFLLLLGLMLLELYIFKQEKNCSLENLRFRDMRLTFFYLLYNGVIGHFVEGNKMMKGE